MLIVEITGSSDQISLHKKSQPWLAQWIECRPANQRVTNSIPSQGTCLGCRLGPQ